MKHCGLIAVLLACLLCSGCGRTAPKALEVLTAGENGQKLSQTWVIKQDRFETEAVYADFLSCYEKAFAIPGLAEGAIPQGITFCGESGRFYLSSYFSSGMASVITAVDAQSGEFRAEYFLYAPDGSPFNSHVGGLAYDGGTLYVSAKQGGSGEYYMGMIPLEKLPESGSHEVTVEKTVKVPVQPSFISCSGGYLWAGNFYYPKAKYELPKGMESIEGCGCFILGYPAGNGQPDEGDVPELVLAGPDRVQGFAVTGMDRIVLSRSYGSKNNSSLLEYELSLSDAPDTFVSLNGSEVPVYILNEARLRKETAAMPMTEGLCTDGSGKIFLLFESGAARYSDGRFRTDAVWKSSSTNTLNDIQKIGS